MVEVKLVLKFEDVTKCSSVADFNLFVRQYLAERGLVGEARRKTYWALFYAWSNSLRSVG
jgi:hypothetical protein